MEYNEYLFNKINQNLFSWYTAPNWTIKLFQGE